MHTARNRTRSTRTGTPLHPVTDTAPQIEPWWTSTFRVKRSDVTPKPRPDWEMGVCAWPACKRPMHILRWTAESRRGAWADHPHGDGEQVSRYHPACDPSLPPLRRDASPAQLDARESVRVLTGGRSR